MIIMLQTQIIQRKNRKQEESCMWTVAAPEISSGHGTTGAL